MPGSQAMKKLSALFSKAKQSILSHHKISSVDIIILFRQLTTLISSGVTIIQGIDILHHTQHKPRLKTMLLEIKHHIERGNYLSDSLRRFSNYFDDITCYLLQIGETCGTFESILKNIADQKEQSYHLTNNIKRCLFYPTILTIVTICVCLIMLLFIVPTFSQVFDEMHIPLPPLTLMVIHLSEWLKQQGYLFLVLFFFYIIFIKNEIKQKLQVILMKLPFISSIFKKYYSLTSPGTCP